MIKPSPTQVRSAIAVMVLAASTLVGIAVHEDYKEEAYIPVPGDVPTIGFGTTTGVRMGDKTTPTRSLVRLLDEVEGVIEGGLVDVAARKGSTMPRLRSQCDVPGGEPWTPRGG